jgi:FemAB-related protein (PEP-CTERM system-associated)
MQMEIVQCNETHRDAWERFIDASGGSFYHRFDWQRINAENFGHRSTYLAAFQGSEVVGVLPIVRLKSRLFGNIACSLPFVNYAGVLASDEQVEAALLQEADRLSAQWNVAYLEIRSRRRLHATLPQSEHKVSLSIELDPDSEKLWTKFKTGHRQEIRKAAKNGFEVRFGTADLIDDFYAVLSESWRDLGTPLYQKRYFESIVRAFPSQVRLAVVYADGQPVGAAFDGFSGRTVEGMWMGAKAPYRSKGVNYVLYWELVKNACERGFERFHLGRSSSDSGGETFKKKWNAQVDQLYWAYVLGTRRSIPQLNVANPKYQFAIRTWQKLPIPVTRVIGPLIARSIP